MRIAVLEDDGAQVELYKLWFSTAQHECRFFGTVAAFKAGIGGERFDLLLVDWMLPDGTGDTVIPWIRETLGWDTPVVCVTLRDSEQDVVNALRLGADDYVVKPPKYFELLARVESLGRRSRASQPPVLRLGTYDINLGNREIRASGKPVELTQKEYELACYLFRNPGKLLSRVHLLEVIWGLHAEIDTRTVDTHVSRIRRKLKIVPETGWEIISVYGYGYRLESAGASVKE
jgi:DNA-binding response OmpR family regulator